jgi:mannose-1-phosphate guanylyltransferase/mannose-6-phosphate isomerase
MIANVVVEDPIVVCNEEHRFFVAEQMRDQGICPSGILLEPIGRNTAPAVAVAAQYLSAKYKRADDDLLLLVLPADHVIENTNAFVCAVEKAVRFAASGEVVTFGIVPTQAHTGYGYIKKGNEKDSLDSFDVAQFIEKPDQETAEHYFTSGGYLWNSGMFLFQSSTFLDALQRFNPVMVEACQKAVDHAVSDLDFIRLDLESFTASPSDSIDYAVMEKTIDAGMTTTVVPLDAGWNDVGSWDSLWEVLEHDEKGNALKGKVFLENTENSLIYCDQGIVATIGINDLIVVRTADALLVADRKQSQQVKGIVDKLKKEDFPQAFIQRKASRPWGTYDCIDESDRFKVKRIVVKPKAKLSLQMHHHRAEHWVVVRGTAKVQRGDETLLLTENESTYIPIGMKHSLENPGTIPLELVEIQSGSYLEEDDIVRFEDIYKRQ